MVPHGGVLVGGKYRLERVIATGGMGSIWSARHEALDARVAVKFMAPLLTEDEGARARFEREARAAAQLRSPHVVQVLDYGVEDGAPFIAMEFLEGEDLAAHLDRVGALGASDAARIVRPIAKALDLAHESGIVHRDIKPRNVFLARVGDDVVPKVCDFGIAKDMSAGATSSTDDTTTGALLGSPHHMSPEQARGERVDHRSDLWSLGVVVFRMLTGVRPFEGNNVGDVIVRICSEPLPRASRVAPHLPPETDRFFERALDRDRARRFQSGREFAAALDELAAIAGDARPESPSARPSADASTRSTKLDRGATADAALGRWDATGSLAGPRASDGRTDPTVDLPAERPLEGTLGASTQDGSQTPIPAETAPRKRRARWVPIAFAALGIVTVVGLAIGLGATRSNTGTTTPSTDARIGETDPMAEAASRATHAEDEGTLRDTRTSASVPTTTTDAAPPVIASAAPVSSPSSSATIAAAVPPAASVAPAARSAGRPTSPKNGNAASGGFDTFSGLPLPGASSGRAH